MYPNKTLTKNQKFYTITYIGKTCNKISRFLSKKGFKIAYKTRDNLGKIIKNNKSKTAKEKKSGVYLLNCGSCPKFYIGQTGRSFENRIKEHKRSYLKNYNNSHYATHLLNDSHKFDDNFKILHYENKLEKLNFLENMEIFKNKNTNLLLNEQVGVVNSPLLNLNL